MTRFARSSAQPPLFKGQPPPLQDTSHRASVPTGQMPLGIEDAFPLARVPAFRPHPVHPRIVRRSHQRCRRTLRELDRHFIDLGSPMEPLVGGAAGTSCRYVQSTFFCFQRRVTASRLLPHPREQARWNPVSRLDSRESDPLRRAGDPPLRDLSSRRAMTPTEPLTPRHRRRPGRQAPWVTWSSALSPPSREGRRWVTRRDAFH